VIDRFLGRMFRAGGPDYPFRAACAVLLIGHFVVALGVLLLAIQFNFNEQEFLTALVLVETTMLLGNLISAWRLRRALAGVRAVLAAEVTDEASLRRAWSSLVALPTRHFKLALQRNAIGTLIPLVAWTVWDQQLSLWAAPLLFAAGLIILLYGFLLRFLVLEIVWRPPLRKISALLPGQVERSDALGTNQLSLQSRLLLGIPLINLITATIVATLSQGTTSAGLENLRGEVVLAGVVATGISLGLSLLFSRSILLPMAEIRKAARDAREGDFTVRVPVVTADEIGRLAIGFNALMDGMQERDRLETALETFSDPAIVEAVKTEDNSTLITSEADVSVMFVDILGFTSFAERTTPQAVVDRLTDYFDMVVPAVERHGGHVNQMFADGLMAVFGAPEALPEHPDRAVDAALEIMTLIKSRFGPALEVGIGINSGPVVAGAIGGGGSARFTVIGDAVNTAERVERATRITGDTILISGATHSRLARDHGGFDERPAVPMKGKSAQVRLWAPKLLSAVEGLGGSDLEDVAAAAPDGLMGEFQVARRDDD
jgi:class 3 adenylate cyclase